MTFPGNNRFRSDSRTAGWKTCFPDDMIFKYSVCFGVVSYRIDPAKAGIAFTP
jgi:hypothetical protein